MLSKNKIKLIQSLGSKKYRQKYNKFTVEGHKTALEFIKSGFYPIEHIIATSDWVENHPEIDASSASKLIVVSGSTMKSISHFKTPAPVLLICACQEENWEKLKTLNRLIFLDSIQDPGNLGTIVRIADWFGVEGILLSTGSVDPYNPKAIAASMGSFVHVPVFRNAELYLDKDLRHHQVVAADMIGTNYAEFDYPDKMVLCMGNEGHGFSDHVLSRIDAKINIPGSANRVAESLNVAVATSIICAQWNL